VRDDMRARSDDALAPITTKTPRERRPVIDAMNEVMSRLRRLLDNRQRFVRDASHQLLTPLAVLKVQVQNARAGIVEPSQGFAEIEASIDRATRVANQMLSLTKVTELTETSEDVSDRVTTDLVAVCRDIAVECSPLLSDKHLDFSLDGDDETAQPVRGADWLLRELLRNLLSNAIRHTPSGGAVGFVVEHDTHERRLLVWDSGPGLAPEQRQRLFQPFATGDRSTGVGLGLVICRDICGKIGATISLNNRAEITYANLPEAATGCVARIVFAV
ncbi:MAG: sensor histidine kinase, partial [Casimicrobium sp.]